ncbi:glycosyltransferase family 2 protein, partial [Paenibacillus gorillae]|uniref:tetratricopeptide repeat-containing glycosyltransferase family 2 protein n=1 Tax=Paenibacillus gorillae TaxID=1243662 RepID=UPI0006933AFB
MIVKNEEQVLARCLDSVKTLVDEVIIVDTGSTDRTKEIAAKYTSRIFSFVWTEDFSAARNYSFQHATQDYILWLDADDWVQEEDLHKLVALKADLAADIDAICMNYVLAFHTLGQPTAVAKRNRIVKRSRQFQWHDPVHEYLDVSGHIVFADITITHDRRHSHSQRNLRIFEKAIKEGAVLNHRQLLHYAMELTANGHYEKAIAIYQCQLDDPSGYFEEKLDACDRMAHCYHELGCKDEQLLALLKTFHYDVPRADYVCRIAYYFQENEDFEKAVNWYELALKLEKPDNRLYGVNHAAWTWLPHEQLAVCYGS